MTWDQSRCLSLISNTVVEIKLREPCKAQIWCQGHWGKSPKAAMDEVGGSCCKLPIPPGGTHCKVGARCCCNLAASTLHVAGGVAMPLFFFLHSSFSKGQGGFSRAILASHLCILTCMALSFLKKQWSKNGWVDLHMTVSDSYPCLIPLLLVLLFPRGCFYIRNRVVGILNWSGQSVFP